MATVWSDQSLQALNQGVLPPNIKVTQFQDLPMPGGYSEVLAEALTSDLDPPA